MADGKGNVMDSQVVFGHKICQTKDAKWLRLDEFHERFYRPNFYDIGGTYIEDLADYWFMCKTEQVSNVFLLHLFILNHQEATINVSLGSNDMIIDKRKKIVYLSSFPKNYEFKDVEGQTVTYLTTYQFTESEVDLMKGRFLYISIDVSPVKVKMFNPKIIDSIKADYDFGALLAEPIGSDFTIESMDEEKFHVHKVLLAAHSAVFKAMLKGDTAESQNNYVKLIDVEKKDLQCILHFIYTGTVKDMEDCNYTNLFIYGDRYDLTGLRQLAQYALTQQLNLDNAVDILLVGDMYNCEALKMAAMNFIKENKEVIQSSAFKEINNVDLMREIFENLVTY